MKNRIRQYRNELWIGFEERGESFTLKVPHKPVWDSIIRFLRKRGWKIGENPSYKEHYASLSKYHKIGFKGEVALLMEILPAGIKIQFGHKKNLWTGVAQSFWEKGDALERYSNLTYLEEMAVNLEIKKMLDYCKKWADQQIMDWQMNAVEQILNKEQSNKHIHGGAVNLQHLAELMQKKYQDPYQSTHNLRDKNKKLIYCGETKYFYDEYRTKRLIRGTVYHNINNMWWVILPCGTLRNLACWQLFDWENSLARREVLTEKEKHNLLLKLTEKALKDRDFVKLQSLSKVMEKIGKEVTNG